MADPKQVKALIKSIKQYSNFRQMAEYNISCLLTYITPPTVGWRENVAAAVEDGGIESIIQVLAKHGNALDMVKQATSALQGLAINKDNAGRVAKNGGIETALQCMLKIKGTGPDEMDVINNGAKLIEKIARYNPKSILEQPHAVRAMLDGIQYQAVPRVQTASANVLDRISAFKEGQLMIVQQDGIKALIESMAPGKPTHEAMLRPLFRLLERLCKDPANVDEIRRQRGVEALVAQLEVHSDNEYILRAGGRLLAKIADSDIEETIRRLGANLPDNVRQHLVGLLANLALQPENVDKIVRNGGIEALLNNFASYNPQTKAAALRALQRIADSSVDNAQRLIDAGGLPIIINALATANGDEDILKAATQALTSIIGAGIDQANLVYQAGGIQGVLDQMLQNPNLEGFTFSGLDMIEKLCGIGFPTDQLLKMGAVDAIFSAMQHGLSNPEVQQKGFEALSALMNSPDDKANALAANTISSSPNLQVLAHSLFTHKNNRDVVKSGVDTFAKLGITESDKLRAVGGLQALTEACYAQMKNEMLGLGGLLSDIGYTRNVKGLLNNLVDKRSVQGLPGAVAGTKGREKLECLKQMAVFALHSEFATILDNSGAANALQDSVGKAIGDEIPDNAVATWSIAKSSLHAMENLVEAGTSKALLGAAKANSKDENAVTAVLRSQIPFVASKDVKARMIKIGIIESAVTGMRSNAQNAPVNLAAVELLLALASSDDSATAVCFKGGARQINKMIKDSSTSAEFEKPIEKALHLLYRIATVDNPEVKAQLTQQDTVNTVTAAMSAFPNNAEILDYGAKVLSLLMTEEDVITAIDDVAKLTAELKTTRKPDKVFEKLGQKAATVGYVALNPQHRAIYVKKDAAGVMDKAVATSKTKPLTNSREVAVKNEYRAHGQIASILNPELGMIDKFLMDLRSNDNMTSLLEKVGILEGIKFLAMNGAALSELHAKGAVPIITDLLNINRSDERFLQAGLDALSALMNNAQGVKLATAAGTGDLIVGVLRDDGENITSRAAASALVALNKFAVSTNAPKLVQDGIIDTVTNTMALQCERSQVAKPEVISAAAELLNTLAVNDSTGAAVEQIVKKGALKKMIDICESSPEYLSDDVCMQNVANLLELLCNNDESLAKLREIGAVDFIMQAMNMNPGNEDLEHCGQRILQKLIGGDASALEQTLKEYDRLLNNVKKAPNGNVAAMQRLNRAQANLKNLMMIEGVVDADGANLIMEKAIDTYNIVEKIPDRVGPIKETILDMALDTIGKTTLIDGAMYTIDLDKALNMLGEVMNSPSLELQIQALKALGVMLAEDPRVVQSAVNMGLVQKLENVLAHATSPEVIDAAQKALENIREQVMKDPSIIVVPSPANDAALAAIIKGISDPADLEMFLEKIAESPHGIAALTRLAMMNLGNPNAELSPELNRSILKTLGNLPTGLVSLPPSAIQRLVSLLANNETSIADKLAIVKLLGEVQLTPAVSQQLYESNAVNAMLDILKNANDPLLLNAALATLSNFAKDPMMAGQILELNGEQQVVDFMKKHQGDAVIQALAFEMLANLKESAGGPEKFVLAPDAIMYLEQALNGLDIGQRSRAKQLVDDLANLYNGEVEPMVLSRFDNMLEVLNAAKNWRVIIDPKTGKPYYHNVVTKETTWTKPQALIAAENALRNLQELAEKSPAEIDHEKLRAAIGHFSAQADEPIRLKALAKALAALAANDANRDAMVNAGLLQALVKALSGGNVDREFILAAISLLNRFAKHPVYKENICKIGGIRALIAIMIKYIKDEEIVEKCEQCLANLAFQSIMCTSEIMLNKGPEAVAHALKQHSKSDPVTLNAMTLLSNLMYKSIDNKKRIGDLLTNRIVAVLRRMHQNVEIFRQTGRALGNIAFIDEHIRTVINLKVVQTLVTALDYHKNDVPAVKLGIDVIGNFASIDEQAYAQDIRQGNFNSVISTIYFEGGAKKIMDVFRETRDLGLMASCIKSLMHLLEDSDVRRKLIGMGVVEMLFGALQQHTQDVDVTDFCIDSIELLSFSYEGVESIFESDGVSTLLQQLDEHAERTDFVVTVTKALVNMSNLREPNKNLSVQVLNDLSQQGGIDTLLHVMEVNIVEDHYIRITTRLLTLLTALRPEVSKDIAQKGMRVILRAVETHEKNPDVLKSVYQLIGLLAFEKSNLKVIVQYGGINLIVKSILSFPENDALVKRSIKTLDNIAMASQEHSNIVKQAKGKKVIEELIKTYETIPGQKAQDVVKACKAALLSLTKIETRKKKHNFLFTDTREADDPHADPLKNHRELLKTGSLVKLHVKGSTRDVHLLVIDKKFQIQWKQPGGKKVYGKIDIKNFTGARKGNFAGHGKKAVPTNTFALLTVEGKKPFCFECLQEGERNRWYDALEALKSVYRNGQKNFMHF